MKNFNLGLIGLAVVIFAVFVYMYYSGNTGFLDNNEHVYCKYPQKYLTIKQYREDNINLVRSFNRILRTIAEIKNELSVTQKNVDGKIEKVLMVINNRMR